jgi:hypothetical protein
MVSTERQKVGLGALDLCASLQEITPTAFIKSGQVLNLAKLSIDL